MLFIYYCNNDLRIFLTINIINMENLDLDIKNYSIHDLETFFQIPQNSKYLPKDIEYKEYELREQLLSSGQVDKRFKSDLIAFLTLAKEILIHECSRGKPTTIPKNHMLDEYEFPVSKEAPPRTNELRGHEDKPYLYTAPSEFFQGALNPLNTRVLTKCLNIDTRFRDNLTTTNSSDFTIQMPMKFNKVVSIQLSALEFPVEFYTISAQYGNNYLYIGLKYNSADIKIIETSEVFIVPDGNYTNNDLVNTINYLLLQKGLFANIQFKLDINANGSGTRKLSIAPIKNTGAINVLSISMDFSRDINGAVNVNSNISSKIGWNLGFIKPTYLNSSQYVADTVMNLNTIRYVYLEVDDFNKSANNYFVNVFNNSIMSPNILARISIGSNNNNQIIIGEPRTYFGPVDIQRLRIRLYDEYGRILPMNNANYSFCLTLKMIYDL
jgi:hypothetical protein